MDMLLPTANRPSEHSTSRILPFDKIVDKTIDGRSPFRHIPRRKEAAIKIAELTDRTGVAERQIRYLIAEGFVPAPRGGRAHAEYDDDHVVSIRRYMRLRELGFPPAAIKLLLQAREGTPFPVAPGITLVIAPDLLASGAPVPPLVDAVRRLLTDLLKEPSHERARK